MITDENFLDHFIPVTGRNRPVKGQVLARFSSSAELVDGVEKRQILDLLQGDGVIPATKVMQKVCHATYPCSLRVCQEMLSDVLQGMSVDEVAAKPYPFDLEMFYYTLPGNIPPTSHWEQISILNEDQLTCKVQGMDGCQHSLDHAGNSYPWEETAEQS